MNWAGVYESSWQYPDEDTIPASFHDSLFLDLQANGPPESPEPRVVHFSRSCLRVLRNPAHIMPFHTWLHEEAEKKEADVYVLPSIVVVVCAIHATGAVVVDVAAAAILADSIAFATDLAVAVVDVSGTAIAVAVDNISVAALYVAVVAALYVAVDAALSVAVVAVDAALSVAVVADTAA